MIAERACDDGKTPERLFWCLPVEKLILLGADDDSHRNCRAVFEPSLPPYSLPLCGAVSSSRSRQANRSRVPRKEDT